MKTIAALIMLGAMAAPAFAATRTFKDVPVVDVNCSRKVAANPDAHTRACALACASSGYGILEHGKYIKFDQKGNQEFLKQLKASSETDHLRVNVKGNVHGNHMKVDSVKLL